MNLFHEIVTTKLLVLSGQVILSFTKTFTTFMPEKCSSRLEMKQKIVMIHRLVNYPTQANP
jgi:hypothetical protein